jgi:hypothetical protein
MSKALEDAIQAKEYYDNQIDRERFDSITEERRFRQVMMNAAIAQAAALEALVTLQRDAVRAAYLNKPE